MKSGQVTNEELAQVDFTLPQDAAITEAMLATGHPTDSFRANIGCTKWSNSAWKGQIYPAKLKDTDYLNEYVNHFNAIELNATFYQLPSAATVANWKERARHNPGFKFCPKFPQSITHARRCRNADDLTSEFYKNISLFGDQLGPMLLQLPESISPKSLPDIVAYIEKLPKDIPVAVELRHKGWFENPEAVTTISGILKEMNVGFVITDTAARRDFMHMSLTSPHAFIRFMGYGIESDVERLNDWVERIAKWHALGLQSLSFFVHTDDERLSPILVDKFADLLNKKLGINIQRPKFISDLQKALEL